MLKTYNFISAAASNVPIFFHKIFNTLPIFIEYSTRSLRLVLSNARVGCEPKKSNIMNKNVPLN